MTHKPTHVMFCVADHFEPTWKKPDTKTEHLRVNQWVTKYPQLARKHVDADGRFAQHTFFYPVGQYKPEHMEAISTLVRAGFGEVEIHIHHENDTASDFMRSLGEFMTNCISHDLFKNNYEGEKPSFGFIHGNWALDNSRKDGRHCGINNELTLLKRAGCYADFTLPSAPDETQTKKINSIYYAKDHPAKSKSHNTGTDVEAGKRPSGDLLIIQGPLALNWKERKWGIIPKIENGAVEWGRPPSAHCVDLWVRQAISVRGREEWVFVKVHTHGAEEETAALFLGDPVDRMFTYLETKYNDGKNYVLHYVTAREMYNIIKAAENGEEGNPNEYRDYILKAKTVASQ